MQKFALSHPIKRRIWYNVYTARCMVIHEDTAGDLPDVLNVEKTTYLKHVEKTAVLLQPVLFVLEVTLPTIKDVLCIVIL